MTDDEKFALLLEHRQHAARLERDLGLELDYYNVPAATTPGGIAVHQLLCEFGRDMIGVHEPDGSFAFVSGNCHALFHWRPEEIIGKHPEDFFQELLSYPTTPKFITYRFRCGNGTTKVVRTQVKETYVGDQRQLLTITQDINEQYVAEETIRKVVC